MTDKNVSSIFSLHLPQFLLQRSRTSVPRGRTQRRMKYAMYCDLPLGTEVRLQCRSSWFAPSTSHCTHIALAITVAIRARTCFGLTLTSAPEASCSRESLDSAAATSACCVGRIRR